MSEDRSGYVYLLKAHKPFEECFKIGRTNNIGRRLHDFGVTLPYKVDLVFAWRADDCHEQEAYLHSRFEEARLDGEWFRLDDAGVQWFTAWGLALEGLQLIDRLHDEIAQIDMLRGHEVMTRYYRLLEVQLRALKRIQRRAATEGQAVHRCFFAESTDS